SSPSSFFLERRQRLEARALELGNPSFGDLVDRGWVDEVQLLAAPASPRNEVRLLEQRQMLGDRLARHGEAPAEFAERLAVFCVHRSSSRRRLASANAR